MMNSEQYYHLFNYSNGFENLFNKRNDYIFFLNKLFEYIHPVCRIFSFSLMPDQYRLVVQVRSSEELWEYFSKMENHQINKLPFFIDRLLEEKVSKAFSNMFNSYAQSYNKWNTRLGSLFRQNMRKEIIRSEEEFRNMIYSAHINPVELGLARKVENWPFSSYQSLVDNSETFLDKEFVLGIFGGLDLFIRYHQQLNMPEIKRVI